MAALKSIAGYFTRRRLASALLIASAVWLLLLFIAPYLVPPGTVANLNGRANAMDYQYKWDAMPPLPRLIYTIGDFNCHQKSARTYYLNGNEMPVCARDVGMFIGAFFGFVACMAMTPNDNVAKTALYMFPRRFGDWLAARRLEWPFIIVFSMALAVPMAVDGLSQQVFVYESTNPLRLITGSLFGFIFAAAFYAIIISTIHSAREIN